MSDTFPDRLAPAAMKFGILRSMPNYRQKIAACIPAMYIAYAVLVWPILFAGGYSSNEFTQGPASTPAPSILSTLVFPALCGLSILLFLAERHRWPSLQTLPVLTLFAVWAWLGFSTSWAIAPADSLKSFIVMTLSLIGLGLATMMVDSIERVMRPVFWVLAVTMLANLLAVLTLPPGPIGHEGIYIHKNELGGTAAVGVLFALYGLTIRVGLYRLVSLFAVAAWMFILVKSESKTSLGLAVICPILGVGATFARTHFRIALPVIATVAAAIILIVVSGGIPGFSQGDLSQLVGGDRTFTGRVALWDFALDGVATRPFTGFGYYSFWFPDLGAASPTVHGVFGFLQVTPTAHNGYLELLLWAGWPAVVLFGVLLLLLAQYVSRTTDQSIAIGCMMATIFTLTSLHNLLETSWFGDNSINAILINTLFMCMISGRPARPPQQLVQLQ